MVILRPTNVASSETFNVYADLNGEGDEQRMVSDPDDRDFRADLELSSIGRDGEDKVE